jgi:membrane associated rhomboid family serine protease
VDLPSETVVRVAAQPALADEWALVLTAAGFESVLRPVEGGWALAVPAEQAGDAEAALADYDRERTATVREPEAPDYGRTWLGLSVALGLLGFYLVTGERGGGIWFARGSAVAERILHGEPWRAVTALTLHADLAHVLGNAVACLILITAVARWIGPGLASWLVLGAGALGNLLTALVHQSHHDSVGASTSSFAAMGILGGLQVLGRPSTRRRRWQVVAASLALLGMLGMGKQADVFAHLFGLVVGGALGALTGALVRRPPQRSWAQPALALGALAAIAGAWLLALR